jgi:hypothetical protein
MFETPPPATAADILWFLPTHGDGRYLGTEIGARHVTLGYLSQIARAADELGISAFCCRRGGRARIPGSSPRPWCR